VLLFLVVPFVCVVFQLEWLVLKMKVGLPGPSVVFDIISEGRRLDKGVIYLAVRQTRVVVLQKFEFGLSLGQGRRAIFQKSILGNVCEIEVAIGGPGHCTRENRG